MSSADAGHPPGKISCLQNLSYPKWSALVRVTACLRCAVCDLWSFLELSSYSWVSPVSGVGGKCWSVCSWRNERRNVVNPFHSEPALGTFWFIGGHRFSFRLSWELLTLKLVWNASSSAGESFLCTKRSANSAGLGRWNMVDVCCSFVPDCFFPKRWSLFGSWTKPRCLMLFGVELPKQTCMRLHERRS